MENNKKLYTEDSIKSLNPREFTRLRAGVYVGSTAYSTQLLVEILSNAIDEFEIGHGNLIKVSIFENGSMCVEDFGQGFLINQMREDGKTVLEAAFSVLNTSGKYDDDGVYEGTALGLNGIGCKLPIFLSHYADVLTHRDGMFERIWFKEGIFERRVVDKWPDKTSGTKVTWTPSEEFFDNPEVNISEITKLFKVLVSLCKGLTIEFYNKGKEEIYHSENGLDDLISNELKGKEIIKNRLHIDFKDKKNKLNLVMTYTDSYSSNIIPYVNTGLTQAGPHITQIKTILTREMNKFFKEKGWLKEKDESLSGEDCQEGLHMVFNLTAPGVAYDAQTKTRIVKLDMKPFTSVIAESLRTWMLANEKEIKIIADKALNARKAREAARKARESARGLKEKKESGLKAKMKLSDKFIDCGSRVTSERNLLLVEGKSAASSAVEARNPKVDAIYMLRGK